jgi:hypothetical protein
MANHKTLLKAMPPCDFPMRQSKLKAHENLFCLLTTLKGLPSESK